MTEEAQVFQLPVIPPSVNGIFDEVDFSDAEAVDKLLRMHADPKAKDEDASLVFGRQVVQDYGEDIKEAAHFIRMGSDAYGEAATLLTRVFLDECERALRLDGLNFKVNGIKNSNRWKRIVELTLDGAGLMAVEGSQSKAERNAANQAINRRMSNLLEVIKQGGHPKSALLINWVRPGGAAPSADDDKKTYAFNFTKPDDCLEKMGEVAAKVLAQWGDEAQTRVRAEKYLEKLTPVTQRLDLLQVSLEKVISDAEARGDDDDEVSEPTDTDVTEAASEVG